MNAVLTTIIGFSVIFLATTLGALAAFAVKKGNPSFNVITFGFSAGVMIAASVWSLILPSIEASSSYGSFSFLPALFGVILGSVFMTVVETVAKKYEKSAFSGAVNPVKLFIAVTVHNVPEGLAVGVAFGAAKVSGEYAYYASALAFAIGIAVQNFPEGAAVALPFAGLFNSKKKAFFIGMLSGAVEPVFAVLGYILSSIITAIEPWLLGFSAGAMLFVAMGDLLPEIKTDDRLKGVWSAIIGFVLMMVLDVALG